MITRQTLSRVARGVNAVTGVVLVLLGVAFWTGRALALVPLHVAIGLTFVASLWMLAYLGLRSGSHRGIAVFALAWGLVVALVGVTQTALLAGPSHWVVQLAHLVIGVVAMAVGAAIHKQILKGTLK
jgi:hypothetical protein